MMKYEGVKKIKVVNELERIVNYDEVVSNVLTMLALHGVNVNVDVVYSLFYLAMRFVNDGEISQETYKELDKQKKEHKLYDEVSRMLRSVKESFFFVYSNYIINNKGNITSITVRYYIITVLKNENLTVKVKVGQLDDFKGPNIGRVLQ